MVDLAKIDPLEKDLSQDKKLVLYTVSDICKMKTGTSINIGLNSWCCNDEAFEPPTCGTINRKSRICFSEKIYQEERGPLDQYISELRALASKKQK